MNEPAPPRVLIVEDDACTATLYKSLIQREGFAIDHCPDGEAALQILAKTKFDVVILDLMMPKIDGMQVLKGMRGIPLNALTPVIVMTTARLQLVEQEALRLGVRFYLDKTQQDKLLAALREIIGEKAVIGALRLRMAPPAPIAPTQASAKRPSVERPIESAEPEPAKGLSRFFRR